MLFRRGLASLGVTLSLLASLPAGAEKAAAPIGVALVDASIDTNHPSLQPYLDEAYFEPFLVMRNGRQSSLAALNRLLKLEYRKALASADPALRTVMEDMNLAAQIEADPGCLPRLSAQEKTEYLAARGRLRDRELIAKARTHPAFNAYRASLHGTHVASLLVKGLRPETRLLHVPYLVENINPQLEDHGFLGFLSNLNQVFTNVDKALKRGNVRVVNVSAGLAVQPLTPASDLIPDPTPLLFALLPLGPLVTAFNFKGLFVENEAALRRIILSSIEDLTSKNPNTVFVFSAGNVRSDVSTTKNDFVHLARPNVLSVAALARDGSIASFSNYSPEHIDVAAPGTCIRGARAGGGEMRVSGTSQATPIVANALAKIFEENPDWSAETAMRHFLENVAKKDPMHDYTVRDGRVFTP